MRQAMPQTHTLSPRPEPWIVPAGMPIVREGEPGTTMYVLVDGAADVMVGGAHIATIGPGGIIGEMAVLTGRRRTATVVARATCWLMPIDEERFTALLRQTPALAMQVMEQLSERLHETNERLAGDS